MVSGAATAGPRTGPSQIHHILTQSSYSGTSGPTFERSTILRNATMALGPASISAEVE